MRIRLSQLRRIIKEEVTRALNESEEPLRVAPARPRSDKFKALRDSLGGTRGAEYKRLFLDPQERYGEVSRGFGSRALANTAMDAFWLGVKPAFEALASDPEDESLMNDLEDEVMDFNDAYEAWKPGADAAHEMQNATLTATRSAAGGRGSVPRDAPMSGAEERNATMGYGGTDNPSYPHNDQW